jgi:p21-activated kinase 1
MISPKSSEYKDHPEDVWDDGDYDDEREGSGTSLIVPPQLTTTSSSPARPTIVISDVVSQGGGLTAPLPSGTPSSPFERYRGWQSEVVAPLEEFIDDMVDPHDHYLDLKEIAEGESGSVYSARLIYKDAVRLRLPPLVKARDSEDIANGREILVAIKSVAILPSGSQKLNDLRHELTLMRGLAQENLISLDALYVDLLEDTLWIRMELMERSLADVIALVDSGLILQDRTMARFASDVCVWFPSIAQRRLLTSYPQIAKGLEYLQQHNIAHRDIRSDNLLLNTKGVLKISACYPLVSCICLADLLLADFANARQVTDENPFLEDPAGVLYWQAPEVRRFVMLRVSVRLRPSELICS